MIDLSELTKLTEIEPKSTKHNEFVQKEDQNDGHKLFSLGLSDIPKVDPHNNIADVLIDMIKIWEMHWPYNMVDILLIIVFFS